MHDIYGLNRWWNQIKVEDLPRVPPTSNIFIAITAPTLQENYYSFCEKHQYCRASEILIGKFLIGKYETKIRATTEKNRPWAYVFDRSKRQ